MEFKLTRILRRPTRNQAFLLIILSAYAVFELPLVIPLPVVGVHAWNESVYLSIVNHMRRIGNPFIFQAAYDPLRPDYNVGYFFYWSAYLHYSLFNAFSDFSPEVFLVIGRIFSLISTLISALLVYYIAFKLTKRACCAYAATIVFLFSPLVMYFGVKFQLEPFSFLVFLLSWTLAIKYSETRKLLYFLLCFAVLGGLIATRQIFAVYVPAIILASHMNCKKQGSKTVLTKTALGLVILSAGFIAPLTLTELVVPEYAPIKFQLSRLSESPTMAFSSPGQSGNLLALYFQNSLFPSLGLSFVFPLLRVAVLLVRREYRSEEVAFLFGGMTYFIFAFLHNVVHMYHSYYFLPVVILSTIYVAKMILETKGKHVKTLFSLLLIGLSVFSVFETTLFYGVGSASIYRGVDPFGNLDSVLAGHFINNVYKTTKDEGLLLEGVTYYSLVQSPAVYYYEAMPTFSYHDFYIWNASDKRYEAFSFSDQASFVQAALRRSLFIVTITPDVYEVMSDLFQEYLRENFVFLASEGVYTFYLNRTLFNKAPTFFKNLALLTLTTLGKNQFAPSTYVQSVINGSEWYRISSRCRPLSNSVLNNDANIFYIDSEAFSNRSLTLEVSIIAKQAPKMQTIVSFDDTVNVRFGESEDVYLELNAEEYVWISGVDASQYYWQNLTLTLIYDVDAKRAEIYANGIPISNTLKGASNKSFPPICMSKRHFIKTCLSLDTVEVRSIKLWNRALGAHEIEINDWARSKPTFTLP